MLEVVQDEQDIAGHQVFDRQFDRCTIGVVLDAEHLVERRHDQVSIGDRGEAHEEDAVRDPRRQVTSAADRERRLAGSPRAGEGHHA